MPLSWFIMPRTYIATAWREEYSAKLTLWPLKQWKEYEKFQLHHSAPVIASWEWKMQDISYSKENTAALFGHWEAIFTEKSTRVLSRNKTNCPHEETKSQIKCWDHFRPSGHYSKKVVLAQLLLEARKLSCSFALNSIFFPFNFSFMVSSGCNSSENQNFFFKCSCTKSSVIFLTEVVWKSFNKDTRIWKTSSNSGTEFSQATSSLEAQTLPMPRQGGKQSLLRMATKNNAAPQHLAFITPTLRGKTSGSCHAPRDNANIFSGALSYFQFGICLWMKSLGEGNIKDIEKLFSFPQSDSSPRDKSIESRLFAF